MNAHDGSPAARGRRSAVREVGVRDREQAVVARLASLSTALDGEPDPAFRAATRARLVAMAAVRTSEPAAPTGLRRWLTARPVESAGAPWRGRLTAGLAGAAVAVTALAGLVGVSTAAQPGDALYGLKRGTEQTQLALASDSSRGQTLLSFASTRLGELSRLLDEGTTALGNVPTGGGSNTVLAAGASPALVIETLRTMDTQTADGAAWLTARSVRTGTEAPLGDLLDWTAGQSDTLSALVPKVPAGARDQMASSLALLTAVSARGTSLEHSLACPSGPATAGADALGPVPTACGVETPAAPSAGAGTGTTGSVPPTDQPATGLPSTGVPTTPPAGGAAGGGAAGGGTSGSGGGSGGSPTVPTIPGTTLPSRPTPSLPLPSLPLPGTSIPGGGTGTAGQTSTSSPPPVLDTPLPICLPPILC